MRNPIAVLAKAVAVPASVTPVPFVPSSQTLQLPRTGNTGATAQMAAYGQVGVVFQIVNRLANSTAQVEWHLYRKAASGKKEERTLVASHAALDLWDSPSSFFDRQEFVEGFQQHIDLTGEGWWIIGRSKASPLPLSMFYVRPDRISPVPHASRYLAGYLYIGPDGEKIPLQLDEVIQLKMPNPLDPYRGMGPMQAAMVDIEGGKLAAEWNRNFFINDASPGGIIRYEQRLTDDEWKEVTDRWRSQHQGVANAHRVAVIEQGEWQERAFNMRDMQFVELRNLSDEQIRKAFGYPKPLLGSVDDVNRANAEAASVVFAQWLLKPRLSRIRGALNRKLLPMYGPEAAAQLEFDFEDPTPEDAELKLKQMVAQGTFTVAMVNAGFDPQEVLEACGLPELAYTAPAPKAPPAIDTTAQPAQLPPGNQGPPPFGRERPHQPRNDDQADQAAAQRAAELQAVQADWQTALDGLMAQWATVTAQAQDDIYTQVAAAAAAPDPAEALANLAVPVAVVALGATMLTEAMLHLATKAAHRVVDEAAAQGVNIDPMSIDRTEVHDYATGIATTLNRRLLVSAGREALRTRTPETTPEQVVQAVRQLLEKLTDRDPLDQLGGALTNAQNSARIATFKHALVDGKAASFYADETLDTSTCVNCRYVDQKWLGNSIDEVVRLYPNGGYRDCLGRERCRGTVVAIWRPQAQQQ